MHAPAARKEEEAAMGIPGVLLAAAAQVEAPPDSVLRLVDLPGLARLEPGVVCRQFASTDPSGRGEDHGHFLALDGRRAVLAEMEGPGVIARLWSANAAGRIRIFLDREEEPRIDAPFQDLFTGKYPPFVEPIATHQGGGWISYLPIAYAKHCRVEVDELDDPRALYYQVQYLTYPRRTPIRTFKRDLDGEERWYLRKIVDLWKSPPDGPPPSDAASAVNMNEVLQLYHCESLSGNRRTSGGGVSLEPGATTPIVEARAGPGLLRFLRLDLEDARPENLRGLILEVAYDGAGAPSISTPVGDLFGAGFGPTPARGLLAGATERGGWLRMPICWRRALRITLTNTTGRRIVAFVTASQIGPQGLPDDLAYLHAEFRSVDRVGEELYEFARVDGAGKFVGLNLTLQGVGDLWYLEGNEELTVDGEARPSIVGTGTEDFFNGGWYWDSGPLALPLHGLGVKEEWTTHRTTPWRHLLPDAIPFGASFVGRIEHGSANRVLDASYASVAFWYGDAPRPVRRVAPEEARLPRRWVRRPKGALPALAMRWTPPGAIEPAEWEDVSEGWRGARHALHQGFPVSHFERDVPEVPAGFARLRGSEARATFMVEEGDRYRLRLQLVHHRAAPKLHVRIDGRTVGDLDPGRAGSTPEPLLTGELGPIGLERGEHQLVLSHDPGGDAEAWAGLDCLVLESAAPFVRSWWVSPPVECDPRGTVEQAPEVEAHFAAPGFDPDAAGWREVADAGEVVDLNRLVTTRAPIFGYLATWLFAPDERVARARLGSDDGVRVWCNGELVWSHALHRPITVDADRFDVPLQKGWNLLLAKVRNDDGGYAFSLRLADPAGTLRAATRRD